MPVLHTLAGVARSSRTRGVGVNLSFQSSLCVLHRTWKRQFRICFGGPDLVTTQHAQTVIRAFLVVLCFSLFQALLNNSHYYHMAKHGDLKKVLFFLFAFLWNVVCVRAEVVPSYQYLLCFFFDTRKFLKFNFIQFFGLTMFGVVDTVC
jgi:hypothetical protein